DGLKLDRSFVTRMLNGASDLTVVRLLVDLCAGLEIRLTAEGVERCDQLQVARSLGVRAIQGNHVARPMALERLQEFLRRGVTHVCDSCFGSDPSVNQRMAAAPAE
ncbi:MAG: EAL domain-containing protein, partial [Actinomycetota bacterium]|nr:EAL domain-containing protein [Actinomycetota bacterium]